MKKLSLSLVLSAVFLGGCEFPKPMTREQQLSMYRATCLDYGFAPDTDAFAKCVKDQDFREEDLELERRRIRALEQNDHARKRDVRDRDVRVHKAHRRADEDAFNIGWANVFVDDFDHHGNRAKAEQRADRKAAEKAWAKADRARADAERARAGAEKARADADRKAAQRLQEDERKARDDAQCEADKHAAQRAQQDADKRAEEKAWAESERARLEIERQAARQVEAERRAQEMAQREAEKAIAKSEMARPETAKVETTDVP